MNRQISINPEQLATLPIAEKIAYINRTSPEVERLLKAAELIGEEVAKYRTGGEFGDEFPDRWLPVALAIVDEPFTEQNGLVNSTMKVVRNKVESHFKERIDYCYTPEGKKLQNAKNVESLSKLL